MAATLLTTAIKSVAGPDSTTANRIQELPPIRTNVSSTERWMSAIAAGLLTSMGFSGRGPGLASGLTGGFLLYRAITGNCPLYQAMKVSGSDATAPNSVIAAGHGTRVDQTIRVKKPIAEVYEYWRNFENFPRFMTHVLEVNTEQHGLSHWRARGPIGIIVEWTAQLITDTRNETIAWKSVDGSDVDITGSVRFREIPGTPETEVQLSLKYDPPLGKLGTVVAKLFGHDPEQQIHEDLVKFKDIMESL
jgi:uncharacterized membrane protein